MISKPYMILFGLTKYECNGNQGFYKKGYRLDVIVYISVSDKKCGTLT